MPPDQAGERLDRMLAQNFDTLSRARFQSLIAGGHVSVNARTISEAKHRVKPGDEICAILPEPEPAEPEGEAIPLTVVFEDNDVIVIDKPAGMVVHPSAGHGTGTLVNALIAHCGSSLSGIGGVMRPGIVHRLDKDTSGLIVVAKTDRAHKSLSGQFKSHGRDGRLSRSYDALVWGAPDRKRGTIDANLTRSTQNRLKIAVTANGGRSAVTHYETLETFPHGGDRPHASLMRCTLETGRTHQIRVHMARIGHPLLGDDAYGAGFKSSLVTLPETARLALGAMAGQALHARFLGFEHPVTHDELTFESQWPDNFIELISALRDGKWHDKTS